MLIVCITALLWDAHKLLNNHIILNNFFSLLISYEIIEIIEIVYTFMHN